MNITFCCVFVRARMKKLVLFNKIYGSLVYSIYRRICMEIPNGSNLIRRLQG